MEESFQSPFEGWGSISGPESLALNNFRSGQIIAVMKDQEQGKTNPMILKFKLLKKTALRQNSCEDDGLPIT